MIKTVHSLNFLSFNLLGKADFECFSVYFSLTLPVRILARERWCAPRVWLKTVHEETAHEVEGRLRDLRDWSSPGHQQWWKAVNLTLDY